MKNQKLIDFRKTKKLTQRQMSELLNVTKSTYEKLEYGIRNPSIDLLQRFSDIFDDFDVNIFLKPNHIKNVYINDNT